jgi:hypothetical protein
MILGFEVLSEAARNPALAKVTRDYYRETAEAIEECLEERQKRGLGRISALICSQRVWSRYLTV